MKIKPQPLGEKEFTKKFSSLIFNGKGGSVNE